MSQQVKTNQLVSQIQKFRQGCTLSILLCIIAAEVLAIFIDAERRLKVFRQETMKHTDDTTILLREFSCHTKTELISRFCEKASISEINFSKSQILWTRHKKIELINQGKCLSHNSSSKQLEYILVILFMITGIGAHYMTV